MMNNKHLIWVEISKQNLEHNIRTFKDIIGKERVLCPAAKANCYGHGLKECAPIMVNAGADWLGVNSLEEALKVREIGVNAPVYIMGYVLLNELEIAVKNGFNFIVYNKETFIKLNEVCSKLNKPAFTHLKLETGNNRQGILKKQIPEYAEFYKNNPLIKLNGVATHFANIEDTIDHSYANFQLNNFKEMIALLEKEGVSPVYRHCANTAATILFPDTYMNMVRTGIGNYGLWPSNETLISSQHEGKTVVLKPVMEFKTRIAQVKEVPAGEFVGYGCTYRAPVDTKLAILPLGYYDGFDRKLSNSGYVLIHGKRAPIRGRICMNMAMVDVTLIPEAKTEDEVVLMGKQGDEVLSAEKLGSFMGTINYEVLTKIRETIPRIVV